MLHKAHGPITDKLLPPFCLVRLLRVNRIALNADAESRHVLRLENLIKVHRLRYPASCKMGTGSFPGVKCGQGVLLTPHPLLVPWSWKSRAIPLSTLWATPGL